jgi:hypothetical protein
MTRRTIAAVALAITALAGCGGGGDDADEPADETTTTGAEAAASEPAIPGLELLDAEPVDDALRPLLSWSPFDGASRYSVLVLDADGAAVWAWEGADTQVHLGGGTDEPLPDDVEGPTTERAATWFVVAHDAEGTPVAASAEFRFGD